MGSNTYSCRSWGGEAALRFTPSDISLRLAGCDARPFFVRSTIDADASNICGLKYIQGMTVTAQGLVTTTIDADDEDTLCSLSADVLPITGVYVPGRRTTLLADVVSLLSGVKGGSLMLRSDGNSDGHFSFYFWR